MKRITALATVLTRRGIGCVVFRITSGGGWEKWQRVKPVSLVFVSSLASSSSSSFVGRMEKRGRRQWKKIEECFQFSFCSLGLGVFRVRNSEFRRRIELVSICVCDLAVENFIGVSLQSSQFSLVPKFLIFVFVRNILWSQFDIVKPRSLLNYFSIKCHYLLIRIVNITWISWSKR